MSRAVANTLLPAARPASTIARPRPRELPVTNHTCAIHPPLSSSPPKYSGEAYQTQDWMRDGYTKGLVKGSGPIKAIETHRKTTDQCKEFGRILMRRNSDRPACVATRQRQDAEIISPTR